MMRFCFCQPIFVFLIHFKLTHGFFRNILKLVDNTGSRVTVEQKYSSPEVLLPDWWKNGSKFEIKHCITRKSNCSEDAQIQKIFKSWPRRIKESDYLKAIKNTDFQTDANKTAASVSRFFDGSFYKTGITILARNGMGDVKSHGGDQWISRIKAQKTVGEMVTRVFFPIERHQDFNNGSYLLIFPDLQKYLENFTIVVEVFLEYSAETVEALRYMMSTKLAINSRQFATKIKTRLPESTAPESTPANHPPHLKNSLALCSFEPFAHACNFSASPARTWYCYHENADCQVSESIAMHNQYLKIISVQPLEWNLILTNQNLFPGLSNYRMKVASVNLNQINYFAGFDRLVIAGLNSPGTELSNNHEFSYVEEIIYPGKPRNSKLTYHDKFCHKAPELDIQNTNIVVIGDSLGRHIAEDYTDYARRAKFHCGEKQQLFWKTRDQKLCLKKYETHGLSPFKYQCVDENSSEATIAFIPHGKVIHHGGCDSVDIKVLMGTMKYNFVQKYNSEMAFIFVQNWYNLVLFVQHRGSTRCTKTQ